MNTMSKDQYNEWLKSLVPGDEVVEAFGSNETIIKVNHADSESVWVASTNQGICMTSEYVSYDRNTGRGNIDNRAVLVGPVLLWHRIKVITDKIQYALLSVSSEDEATEILYLMEQKARKHE